MKTKLAIVHFDDIGKYPPALNLVRFIANTKKFSKLLVCSRSFFSEVVTNVSWWHSTNKESNFKSFRGLSYLFFYLKTFIGLIRFKSDHILYYERLSFPPVFWYYKLAGLFGKKVNIYCHYHEFTSIQEISEGMSLGRYAHYLENKTYNSFRWISHTNLDRIQLFLQEHPGIKLSIQELPNYPPKSWSIVPHFKSIKGRLYDNEPLKIVYVGSLDIDTMYVKELAAWIENQKGKVRWDIYSGQFDKNTSVYFKNLNSRYIHLKGRVDYEKLPTVLIDYQVGVILYKGTILNHIYSEPNKYFEYYVCGLDVWYPKEIVGMKKNKENGNQQVLELDFCNLPSDFLQVTASRCDSFNETKQFESESVYERLVIKITAI